MMIQCTQSAAPVVALLTARGVKTWIRPMFFAAGVVSKHSVTRDVAVISKRHLKEVANVLATRQDMLAALNAKGAAAELIRRCKNVIGPTVEVLL